MIGQLRRAWSLRLQDAGIENAAAESEIILSYLTGLHRAELFLHEHDPISDELRSRGEEWIRRRCLREPLQYLTGIGPFRMLDLIVTPAVLIPRPETELLVNFLLRETPPNARIADVGTGSGAIALSLLSERSDLSALALDISPDALAVAQKNAEKYSLTDRISFRQSNLLSAIQPGEIFGALAANLPYVTEEEYPSLQPEVRDYEPKLALTAPDRGFALIEQLARSMAPHLLPGAPVIFELDGAQAPRLAALLHSLHLWDNITIRKDYCGVDRFVSAKKKGV